MEGGAQQEGGEDHKTDLAASASPPISLIRAAVWVVGRAKERVWSDKSMQCEDTERPICTAFMLHIGEDEEKKIRGGGTANLHVSPRFFFLLCVSLFSFLSDCRLSG